MAKTATITVPGGVKIQVLRSVAAAKFPQQALPTIAANHNLTLDAVKDVVQAHGWPNPDSMRRAAKILEDNERRATAAADGQHDQAANVDDEPADKFVQIRIEQLTPDPANVRENLGDLTELADSMVQVGLVQPIVARRHRGQLIVVSGHRRLAAAKTLRWTTIPCVIKADMHPDDVLAAMLVENGQRANLDPIEEARALGALKQREGLTDDQVARRVGRSQPFVSNRIALLDLPPADQAAVRAGTMTITAGTNAGRKHSGKAAGRHRSTAYLSETHPLAELVTLACRKKGHKKNAPGRVGGVGCGRCWEDVIRADERRQLDTNGAPA